VIDGFALDLDQRVVTGFEIHLFGEVLEHPGRTALRMGRGDDTQRLSVRQMPGIGLRVERLVDGKRRVLPVAPVQLLGKLAIGAQPVEQLAIVRLRFQERQFEAPELYESLVIELQPALAVEDRDRRREMVERLGMAFQRALQFLAYRFGLGNIDRHASRAVGRHDVGDIEYRPVAMDHGREAVMERRKRGGCRLDHFPADRAEQLAPFAHGLGGARCIDGIAIGVVDPGEFALGVPAPDRLFDRVEQRLENGNRAGQALALDLELGEFSAQIVESQETDEGLAAGNAALDFQHLVAIGLDHHVEAARLAAKLVDRLVQIRGRIAAQPAAEGEEVAIRLRRAGLYRQLAEKFGLGRTFPHNDAAVLVGDQRLVFGNPLLCVGKRAAHFFRFGFHVAALANEPQRGKKGGTKRAEHERGNDDFGGGEQTAYAGLLREGRRRKGDQRGSRKKRTAKSGEPHKAHAAALACRKAGSRARSHAWARIWIGPLKQTRFFYRHNGSVSVQLPLIDKTYHFDLAPSRWLGGVRIKSENNTCSGKRREGTGAKKKPQPLSRLRPQDVVD
jgi:hypothetical protein